MKLQSRAFLGLHQNLQKRRQKQEDLELLATLHRTNVLRKVYLTLADYSEQCRDLHLRAAVVRRANVKRVQDHYFRHILHLFRRRQHD
mmetsp:Transcript_18404/g.28233  ORF Transcript_18404/g.28233 Transcript_18404/m.28233 type:complete len:88 (+) Transcript_18404:1649-1912(+)